VIRVEQVFDTLVDWLWVESAASESAASSPQQRGRGIEDSVDRRFLGTNRSEEAP